MAEVQKKKKRAKKAKQEIILTPEEKFAQLLALKKSIRCILGIEDKYKIYVRLTKEFAEFGKSEEADGVEGADQCGVLSEECRRKAEELEKQLPLEKKQDDRTVTTTVRQREEEKSGQGKKGGKTKWLVLAILVLGALMVVAYNVTASRYVIAGVESKIGLKDMAVKSYDKLGDYKESPSLKLEVEQKLLARAKKGQEIEFGELQWLVLEKTDTAICLAKYEAMNKTPFHNQAEEVTWETCSLRRYLNNEFLNKNFSEQEKTAILDTDVTIGENATYATKSGNTTKDKVFIMNEAEAKKYKKVLKEKRKNMRLRTPGRDLTSTTYIASQGTVIDYGFPVEKRDVCIRPVIWVRL